MASSPKVHAFVMAGGEGSRLQPLTGGQCKPALPFGSNYRVVDFVLGNLWNSQVPQVDLLVQYQPDSLVEHVRRHWMRPAAGHQPFVKLLPPPPGTGRARVGYLGTADAVQQNLRRLDELQPDLVLVFGADHVYRMDVRQMIDFHLAHGADVTVATLPVPLDEAGSFGIVDVDAGHRIQAFHEKPQVAPAMPGRPDRALASMGNYVFSAAVLRRELERAAASGETDFGTHILPRMVASHRIVAYDFNTNRVPGVNAQEDRGYWRDIGTLGAYFAAQLDALGSSPRFSLHNPDWPVLPQPVGGRPALLVRSEARRSRFGSGAHIDGAKLDQAVIGRNVRVARGARLERCVAFDGVSIGIGARLRNVVIDEDNAIPAGEVIGHDETRDRQRFHIGPDGLVIVPRGYFGSDGESAGRGAAPARERVLSVG